MIDVVNRAHNEKDGKNHRKPWKWMVIDSLIIGGVAMAAAMPGTVPTLLDVWIMVKAFAGSFLIQLCIERGLKKEEE